MAVRIKRPKLVRDMDKKIVALLEKHGMKICHVAAAQRNTHPDTWNQQDAYGWGVYRDGTLIREGFARRTPAATEPKEIKGTDYWGRKEIRIFLESYHPELAGWTLVVANAMFYSSIHESGHTPSGRIYRIVTQTYGMLHTAAGDIISQLKLDPKAAKEFSFGQWTYTPQGASMR